MVMLDLNFLFLDKPFAEGSREDFSDDVETLVSRWLYTS